MSYLRRGVGADTIGARDARTQVRHEERGIGIAMHARSV